MNGGHAPRDEALVDFVADRITNRQCEAPGKDFFPGPEGAAGERARDQPREDAVNDDVTEFPEWIIPPGKDKPEVRNAGEKENKSRPENDGQPKEPSLLHEVFFRGHRTE